MTMSNPLLCIHNRHTAACGDAPIIDSENPQLYIGYFENSHGEQWIFTYNRATKAAELRGGDTGWNSIFYVRGGKVAELILGRDEETWLMACWRAATGG